MPTDELESSQNPPSEDSHEPQQDQQVYTEDTTVRPGYHPENAHVC